MNILHIAKISNSPFNGVFVVVPEHVRMQQQHANVAFLNLKNESIPGIANQISYTPSFSLTSLSPPFSRPDIVIFHEVYRPEYLSISKELGTRHRAGLGTSETTDAVVLIVSEETGTITLVVNGILKRHLAPETLERLLIKELMPVEDEKTDKKGFWNSEISAIWQENRKIYTLVYLG